MSLLQNIFGGIFSAYGTVRANGGGILQRDRWEENENPTLPFADADTVSVRNDWAWFEGTYWVAGQFGISGTNYGFARWDWDTGRWVGFSETNGPIGVALLVWKGKLYFAKDASGSEKVQRLTYNRVSKVITIESFSWNTGVGAGALARDILEFDFDGTLKLVFVGSGFTAGGGNEYVRVYTGSGFEDIGGPTTAAGNIVRGVCRHDFGDGEQQLAVVGKFAGITASIGSGTGYGNVAKYKASNNTWSKIGAAGLAIPAGSAGVSACASFNDRLWATRQDPNTTQTALAAILNGAGNEWREAHEFLKNLDAPHFWQYDGTSQVPASALTLAVHAGRLYVGGVFQFRGLRRGGSAAGAITYLDVGANVIYTAKPFVNGSARALCIYQGKLVFGGACSFRLPDKSLGRFLGTWTDPNDPEADGTFAELGGGVNGPVYGACVWNGDLYVVGDFTEAGGVAVKGIARWDGSQWYYVVNVSDYGTARHAVVFDGELIIAGEFSAVDGLISRKLAARITFNGTAFVTSALWTAITGVGGDPEIHAVYVSQDGNYLYIGGNIDQINDGSGLDTMKNIARTQAGSAFNWEAMVDNDGPATRGINSGEVWSIGERDIAGTRWIYAGCDPSAKGGASAAADPLWQWNTSTPDWQNAESALVGTVEPITAIASKSDASTTWFTFFGTAGGAEGPQNRIRRHPSNAFVGSGTGGQAYSALPSTLVYGNAGAGDRLYIGNERGSLGNLAVESSAPAMLITSINSKNEIQDVAGGCGMAGFFDFAVQDQEVTRIRNDVPNDTRHEIQSVKFRAAIVNGEPAQPTGEFKITITDYAGKDVETGPVEFDPQAANIIANINEALDAALGVGRVVATGEDWALFRLTYSGLDYALHNHPMARFDIEEMEGVSRVDVERETRVPTPRLLVSGIFPSTSRGYCQFLTGIDVAGHLTFVGEGLAGSYNSSLQRFPADIKPVPADRFPDEWADPDVCDLARPCQPNYTYVFLGAGNFSQAINGKWVRDADSEFVKDLISAPGIFVHDGMRYFRDVGIKVTPIAQPETAELFGGKIVAGGGGALEYYRYSDDTWQYFIDPGTAGSMLTDSLIRKLITFGSVLVGGGQMSFQGFAGYYAMMNWNGASFTKIKPAGFSGASTYVRDIVAGNLGGGTKLYAGGFPDLNECPVVESADGASWSAVGGNTKLRGECYSLATLEYPNATRLLVAHGALSVNVGGVWTDAQQAYWNGANWTIGAAYNPLAGPSEKAAIGDWSDRAACDERFARVIYGGDFIEVAEEDSDLGTAAAKPAFGLGIFKDPNFGTPDALPEGGVNGRITCAGTAAPIIWPA